MKNDFTHDHLEDFLKRSADGLRMKPPDKVWQNLSKELANRRRRALIVLAVFLLLTSATGYYLITNVTEQKTSSQPKTELPTKPMDGSLARTNASAYRNSQSVDVVPIAAGQHNTGNLHADPIKRANNIHSSRTGLPSATVAMNPSTTGEEELTAEETFTPTVVDSYDEAEKANQTKTETKPLTQAAAALPLTIESVINAYKSRNKFKRLETQLYFTPSVSYRKLAENKSYQRTLDPAAAAANFVAFNSSVNSNVTHKPDVGFEVGFAAKYALSKNFKLRSGLQFNVNRYDVKAFSSPLSVATIALNNGSRVDSLNTISSYSNINGYKSDWLQNLYFQLSVPVGAEYLIKGNDKMQFGIAATVQPTYVLGDRAYLITTDYKSYAEVPWLIRRWNVNTALETFITYQGAKTKWQIGPQVRYQLLSSFISKYPVKENLFDFGLKVGVSLNKR